MCLFEVQKTKFYILTLFPPKTKILGAIFDGLKQALTTVMLPSKPLLIVTVAP